MITISGEIGKSDDDWICLLLVLSTSKSSSAFDTTLRLSSSIWTLASSIMIGGLGLFKILANNVISFVSTTPLDVRLMKSFLKSILISRIVASNNGISILVIFKSPKIFGASDVPFINKSEVKTPCLIVGFFKSTLKIRAFVGCAVFTRKFLNPITLLFNSEISPDAFNWFWTDFFLFWDVIIWLYFSEFILTLVG